MATEKQTTKASVQEWAKEQLKEMDAKVATVEGKLGQLHGDAHAKAESALSEMRASRTAFQATLKKEGEAVEANMAHAKATLDTHLSDFRASAKKALSHTGEGSK
jgi:hypothetical protein